MFNDKSKFLKCLMMKMAKHLAFNNGARPPHCAAYDCLV